jgi:hypothetical protein
MYRLSFWPTQSAVQYIQETVFPEVKQPEDEDDISFSVSSDERSFISIPVGFLGVLLKQSSNIMFTK